MAGKKTITSVLSASVLGLKRHARQWFTRALAPWREELKNWKQKSFKMIYLWSFILSGLCCRTIYRGVAVLVSI